MALEHRKKNRKLLTNKQLTMEMLDLNKKFTKTELRNFSEYMQSVSGEIGFKVSSRGWSYILEGRRIINKNHFNKVTKLINNCRELGFLPIDFVADESSRMFHGVEFPNDNSVVEQFGRYLGGASETAEHYTPDWWDGEEYYIQMVVEKIDLVTLFQPVCNKYHIPIANAKGWSSMLQRAEYARRFKEAEEKGLQCILLYCGDHDPDGLRISEFIRRNLTDLQSINWEDGTDGYDPTNLQIERFGLNYDFIVKHKLTWIDNLITGSGKNLASPLHKNFKMPYVQHYLKTIGEKKCEANAVVTMPDAARKLVEETIVSHLGTGAVKRFAKKRQAVRDEFNHFMSTSKLDVAISKAQELIRNW